MIQGQPCYITYRIVPVLSALCTGMYRFSVYDVPDSYKLDWIVPRHPCIRHRTDVSNGASQGTCDSKHTLGFFATEIGWVVCGARELHCLNHEILGTFAKSRALIRNVFQSPFQAGPTTWSYHSRPLKLIKTSSHTSLLCQPVRCLQ